MACNYCNRAFSLFRRDKRCPSCGFSFCGNCLNNTVLVKKLNVEKKVCIKCSRYCSSGDVHMIPPPDYYRNGQGNKKTCKSKIFKYSHGNKTNPEINKPRPGIRYADVYNKNRAAADENFPTTSNGYPRKEEDPETSSDTEPSRAEGNIMDDFPEESEDENDIDVLNALKSLEFRRFNATLHDHLKNSQRGNQSSEAILRNAISQLKADFEGKTLPKRRPTCTLCIANAVVNCKGCRCKFCMICFDMHTDDVCVEYETLEPHEVNQF